MRTSCQFSRRKFIRTGLIFVPSCAVAQDLIVPRILAKQGSGGGGGGGGCSTASEKVDTSYLNDVGGNFIYTATYIPTPAVTETVCRIDAFFACDNTLASTFLTLEVWSYGSAVPGSLITSSSTFAVGLTPNLGSPNWFSFTGLNWSKTSGTDYTLVLHATGTNATAINMQWRTGNIGDPGHRTIWHSSDGSSWTPIDIANLDRCWFREFK